MKKMKYFMIFSMLMVFTVSNLKSQPGCPSVDAGSNQTLNCNTTCTNLTATMLATGATTSYAVSSIPYSPPYSFSTGTPCLVAVDDLWGPVITLPFTFCFYGTAYTQIVAGSNGLISFGPTNANNYCAWSYTASCPNVSIVSGSTGPYVFGPYEDIDPAVSGTMYYAILGTYPCRTFEISWNQCSEFSCTTIYATTQIVLYENTNVVEVYIQNKPLCSSWNSGNATLGIQDATGTNGICPPGRNTSQWTASNEAWRFTPNGAPNYAFSWWSNFAQISTNPTINVCPPTTTTYTAQIIYNLCTGQQLTLTDDVTVTVNSAIGLTISPATDTICEGTSTTLTASSTNPLATFQWSTGPPGPTLTVTPAATTTYTVTATTAGCTDSGSETIVVNANPVVTVSNSTVCNGQSATLTANGANSYVWNTTDVTSSITVTPTTTTTYTVTGTTSGCTNLSTSVVTVNPQPVVTASNTNETCGLSNGTATASPTGNCTQYSYLWNTVPQQTTQTAINIPGGVYTVTVTCSGCTTTATTSISNLAGPSVSITNPVNSTCGQSNGSADANATGGTTPYTYSWNSNPVQTTSSMINVPAGTYVVIVTDVNGCTASNSITITTTAAPVPTISGVQNASCNQSNGGINLSVNGGTSPYTFNWNSNPAQLTQNLTGVPTGNYTVTVTDASGCTASTTAFVPENPGPTATTTFTDELCNQSNGTATVIPNGGSGVYTYIWSTIPQQTTPTATGLPAGIYSVTVNDGFCTTSVSVTISNIPGPTAGFSAHPTIVTGTETPVSFLNNSSGSIDNCFWNFGDGTTGTGNTISHTFTSIGTYVVTMVVSDNNGCTDTATDTILVRDIFTIYIPNAFTPNGDSKNDTWYPSGVSVDPDNYDCKIFDRWGKLMFHTTKWALTNGEPWNGTMNNKGSLDDVVVGVYIYRIVVRELAGNKHEYIGRISLVP